MTTASGLIDGLLTNLNAASVFGGDASISYKVLEQASGSCAVISVVGMEARPSTFGNPRSFDAVWMLRIEAFAKDTGDPGRLLERVVHVQDAVVFSLTADDTLQGTCDGLSRVRAAYEPGRALTAGGAAWLPVVFEVEARILG